MSDAPERTWPTRAEAYDWSEQPPVHSDRYVEYIRADLAKALRSLKPFADCVFNDNGDVTISYSELTRSAFVAAYRTLKEISHD